MRYRKRDNSYIASNFQFEIDSQRSWSYDWWLFSTKYKGKLIFNHTYYSSSTCKHQQKALGLLDYKYDLKLRNTTRNLRDVENCLKDEIKSLRFENRELRDLIKKPRTRKSTNEFRYKQIKDNFRKIIKIENLLKSEV